MLLEIFPKIKPSFIPNILESSWKTDKQPVMLWGLRGCGKTSYVEKFAANLDINCRIINLQSVEPTDLIGLPAVVNGKTQYTTSPLLPCKEIEPNWSGIVFFDELAEAPPLSKTVLFSILNERRFGTWHLPDNVLVVAASNPQEEGSLFADFPPPLVDRMENYVVEPSVEDFVSSVNLHPLVVKYLNSSPSDLYGLKASPRSWEKVSKLLYNCESEVLEVRIKAKIGTDIGSKFIHFMETNKDVSPKQVLRTKKLSGDPDFWMFATQGWVVDSPDKEYLDQSLQAMMKLYNNNLLPKEAVIVNSAELVKKYIIEHGEKPDCKGFQMVKELKASM